jgi:hypothetical protein
MDSSLAPLTKSSMRFSEALLLQHLLLAVPCEQHSYQLFGTLLYSNTIPCEQLSCQLFGTLLYSNTSDTLPQLTAGALGYALGRCSRNAHRGRILEGGSARREFLGEANHGLGAVDGEDLVVLSQKPPTPQWFSIIFSTSATPRPSLASQMPQKVYQPVCRLEMTWLAGPR